MILVAITSLFLAWLPLVATQCYDQSGEAATGTPCNTGSLPTFCCPSGYSCLSNGLCGKGSALEMGTCSDQSWSGGSCIKYCPAGYINMAMCIPEPAGNYCCETTLGTTCCSGKNIFHLGEFAQVSTVPFTTLARSTSTKTTSKASKTSSGSSSSPSSSSSSSVSSTTLRNSTPIVPNPTATGSATVVPAESASVTRGLSTSAKIGTIVGGVCAFAFVGFLIYFITFLLKRRHQDRINAERARQIQAKVARNINTNNDGRHDGEGFTSGTVTATSRGNLASQFSGTEILSNQDQQYTESSAGVPQQIDSISPQTGHQHTINAGAYEPAYMSRPMGGSNSYGSVSPRESYQAYRQSSVSIDHELGNLDPVAAAQYSQLPSHYSFSGLATPAREMTPAQELAAARLRSNISPIGLKGIED